MSNYIIYKITCNTDISGALIYVGSTQNYTHRKWEHKSRCNKENGKEYNKPVYKMIRENGGLDNWNMQPIEELNNATKIQARIREQHWINFYKNTSNERKSYSSEEEKKEYYKEYTKNWQINNREKINAYQREWQRKKKNTTNNIEPNDFNQGEPSPENVSDGDQL